MNSANPLLRIVAIVALVLILILGAWGIIVVITGAPSFFSNIQKNLGENPASPATALVSVSATQPETLSVTLPSGTLTSGGTFTLSWSHQGGASEYGYTISYSCGATGAVTIDAPLPTGSYQAVACNTPFNFTNATMQMTLLPHVSGTQGGSVQFTVSAIDLASGTTSVSGTAIASIESSSQSSAATVASTPATSVNKGVSKGAVKGYVSNAAGIPDLAVQILSAGNSFVQFRISNVGMGTAPAGWMFIASLPGSYTRYTSPQENALAPGNYLIDTLNWNPNSYNYNQTISITVDPYDAISDLNRYNNTATAGMY